MDMLLCGTWSEIHNCVRWTHILFTCTTFMHRYCTATRRASHTVLCVVRWQVTSIGRRLEATGMRIATVACCQRMWNWTLLPSVAVLKPALTHIALDLAHVPRARSFWSRELEPSGGKLFWRFTYIRTVRRGSMLEFLNFFVLLFYFDRFRASLTWKMWILWIILRTTMPNGTRWIKLN